MKYYTAEEIAQMLNVSSETVRRWVREGKLPAIKAPSPTDKNAKGIPKVYVDEISLQKFAQNLHGFRYTNNKNGTLFTEHELTEVKSFVDNFNFTSSEELMNFLKTENDRMETAISIMQKQIVKNKKCIEILSGETEHT